MFVLILSFIISLTETDSSDVQNYLHQAHHYFDQGSYLESIECLESALASASRSLPLYHYLGYYTHYLCYDSRPYPNYSANISDTIIYYLTQSIILDPNLRDSYYFLGVEYGVISRRAIQFDQYDEVKESMIKGFLAGCYPPWLLEYARNTLDCCKQNAILFISGDAEVNAISYLQWIDNYRQDISPVIIPLCNRSWYIEIIKEGFHDLIVPVPISWNTEQIYETNNYKWNSNIIHILLYPEIIRLYELEDSVFQWTLSPDLTGYNREYLSPAKAIITDIIEQNAFLRPVYFSLSSPALITDDFDSSLVLCGLARQLVPYNVYERGNEIDIELLENFLGEMENFTNFQDLRENDLPRVSKLLNNYRYLYLNLITYYYNLNNLTKADYFMQTMEEYLPDSVLPLPENLDTYINQLKNSL